MPKVSWSDHQVAILIDEFEKYPILHNPNHPAYRTSNKRQDAYSKIYEIIKEVRPETTEIEVIKKIKGFRATFISECNRILESEKIATCPEDVYTPNIWYFYKLRFLNKYYKTKVTFRNLFYEVMDDLSDDENYDDFDEESEFEATIVKPEDVLRDLSIPATDTATATNISKTREDLENIPIKIEPINPESESENNNKNFEEIVTRSRKRKTRNINVTDKINTKRKRDKNSFDDWKNGLIAKLDKIIDEKIQIKIQNQIDMLVFEALMEQECG